MAGNQLRVCVFFVVRVCVCIQFREKSMPKERKKSHQTALFSNPVCPLPCSQDSSSLHYTTGCFCTITRMLLTYMEMLCENKKLLLPSCPLYAPESVCVYVHARVCVFCMLARCVHSDFVFRGNCSLWCSPMQATADTPISLHGADASFAGASPLKTGSFQC